MTEMNHWTTVIYSLWPFWHTTIITHDILMKIIDEALGVNLARLYLQHNNPTFKLMSNGSKKDTFMINYLVCEALCNFVGSSFRFYFGVNCRVLFFLWMTVITTWGNDKRQMLMILHSEMTLCGSLMQSTSYWRLHNMVIISVNVKMSSVIGWERIFFFFACWCCMK